MATSIDRAFYANHGTACLCSVCRDTRMQKRDTGDSKNEQQIHLATAHALHHDDMRSKHSQRIYRWGSEGQPADQMTVEMKAKHLQAESEHRNASEHFRDAARAFRDGLPNGAKEHMKIAENHAAKADKMSRDLGVA